MHGVDTQLVVVIAIGAATLVRIASALSARRAESLVPVRVRRRQPSQD